jgi:hypothetical protein
MSFVADGTGGYLTLLLAGFFATEIWRWMGILVGSRLTVDGAVFQWVKAVATTLIAAMVSRMLLFPAGQLAGVPFGLRVGAFLGGIAIFYAARRNLGIGVAGGGLLMLATTAVYGYL